MSNLKHAKLRLDAAKRVQKDIEVGDHQNAPDKLLRILKDISTDSFQSCQANELPAEWETFNIVARCAYDLGLCPSQPSIQPHISTWVTNFKQKWSQIHKNPSSKLADFIGVATAHTLTFV